MDFLSKYIFVRPDEALAIAGILHLGSFKKNSLWMEEGQVCDKVGVIFRGCARTYYLDKHGRDLTHDFHWEFDILISPQSFFGRKPAVCNTVAMENMEVVYARHEDVMAFLNKHPRFETVVKDLIRDNIHDISDHKKLLQMVSAQERYEEFIASRNDIVQRVPLKHIATYLGMTTETLRRIRGRIKQ